MNKRFIAIPIVILAIVFLNSCRNNQKDLFSFNLSGETNFTIPSSTNLNQEVVLLTDAITSGMPTVYSDHSTSSAHIFSVEMAKLKLKILSPSGANMTFIDSIGVYITADGLDTTYIGGVSYVPESAGAEISLDMLYPNIKSYLFENEFKLIFHTTLDKIISDDYSIDVEMLFTGEGEST